MLGEEARPAPRSHLLAYPSAERWGACSTFRAQKMRNRRCCFFRCRRHHCCEKNSSFFFLTPRYLRATRPSKQGSPTPDSWPATPASFPQHTRPSTPSFPPIPPHASIDATGASTPATHVFLLSEPRHIADEDVEPGHSGRLALVRIRRLPLHPLEDQGQGRAADGDRPGDQEELAGQATTVIAKLNCTSTMSRPSPNLLTCSLFGSLSLSLFFALSSLF